jgi:hypothetical protein
MKPGLNIFGHPLWESATESQQDWLHAVLDAFTGMEKYALEFEASVELYKQSLVLCNIESANLNNLRQEVRYREDQISKNIFEKDISDFHRRHAREEYFTESRYLRYMENFNREKIERRSNIFNRWQIFSGKQAVFSMFNFEDCIKIVLESEKKVVWIEDFIDLDRFKRLFGEFTKQFPSIKEIRDSIAHEAELTIHPTRGWDKHSIKGEFDDGFIKSSASEIMIMSSFQNDVFVATYKGRKHERRLCDSEVSCLMQYKADFLNCIKKN